MTEAFPSTLPLPLLRSYSVRAPKVLVRTEMDSGAVRQRRQYTNAFTMVAVRWVFDETQMGAFDTWYRTAINDGASWFTISLPITGVSSTVTARFTAEYSIKFISHNTKEITAQIEVRAS